MTESGKPLQCWIKDGKMLLVMSRRVLIYDFENLCEDSKPLKEIKLKEDLMPQITFASCASLAAKPDSAGELSFWIGFVGPRRRVAQLQAAKKVEGNVFAAYGSYATKMIWRTDPKEG